MSTVQGHHAQVQLNSFEIKSKAETFDLVESKSGYLQSLSIYTSLFSPLMRMTVILNDYFDVIKGMKLIGNEEITVNFKYIDEEKDTVVKFRLNSILDGARRTDQKSGQLILDCVSYDYLGFYTRVSKKLKGTSDSIISSLLNDIVQVDSDVFLDSGETELELQSNMKSVLDTINLVCKHDNKFFYQELDGYYTKSLDGIMSEPSKDEIFFLINQKDWFFSDVAKSYKFEYWNNELLLENNAIHPNYINLDDINYKVNEIDNKFSDIGSSNFFEDLEEKQYTDIVYGEQENKMKRQIAAYNLSSNTISIKINGYEKRRVGDKLTLNYRGRDEVETDHPLYKGDWIIVGIRNEMGVSDYIQTIKLAKVKYRNL